MDSANSQIVMYWRPGCGFCAMLERNLQVNGLAYEKRNIWDDPEAASFVRSVANGNETVPTVVIGEQAMVNPSINEVAAALQG